MSIAEKLNSILESKQAIKEAIIEKGISDVSDVLSDYPSYILNIPSGGDEPDIPEPDEPDEPIEEWVYPEDWPDLEQVLEENQIEGYPYRIIQLLGKGTSATTFIKVRPVINDGKGTNPVTWNTIVKCSDGGSYDLPSPTDDFYHTWTSSKTEYRWIIFYFKENDVVYLPPTAKDCLCIILDGMKPEVSGSTSSSALYNSVDILFSSRYNLKYIKGINGASIASVNSYTFSNCYNLEKIDIEIDTIKSGLSLFSECEYLLEVPKINDSINNVSFSRMFRGCSRLRSIPETIKTDKGTDFSNMFYGCSRLRYIPDIKTDNGTSFSDMFYGCSRLRYIPETIKTDKSSSFYNMFYGCSSLTSIPESIKTDNGTNFNFMFHGCSNLKSIPETIKTDNGTSFTNMFYGCSSLTSIPESIKTDNGTTFGNMFYGCSRLRSIPETIKTDNGTSFTNMFEGCSSLTSIPESIKTDNGTNFSMMFSRCSSLTSIPEAIKTDKGTDFSYMFRGCSSLRSIPKSIKTDKGTSFSSMFEGCSSLEEIDGINITLSSSYGASSLLSGTKKLKSIKNFILGKSISPTMTIINSGVYITDMSINITGCTGSNINSLVTNCPSLINFRSLGTIDANIDFSKSLLVTYESLMNVLNSLSPVTSTKTLKLGAENLAKLTEEEIAIGTDKGWSITA